jgi:hypothetical protein
VTSMPEPLYSTPRRPATVAPAPTAPSFAHSSATSFRSLGLSSSILTMYLAGLPFRAEDA